ncbi:MAG: hypothetical protein IKO40_11190 [Kiritimatiellae bacterium]|nr:hypothetical protein [Kiritimatiellia bacterium]
MKTSLSIICLLAVVALSSAIAGGISAISAATGFWHLSQDADGRWWAVSPAGEATFLRGVDHANWNGHYCEALKTLPYRDENAKRFGGDRAAWVEETLSRLKEWGFNALGAGCSRELENRGLAHTVQLEMGQRFCKLGPDYELSHFEGRPGTAFPNVRHPEWPAFCDKRAAEICAAQKDNPDLFGYFFDNELSWRDRTSEEAELYFSTIADAIRRHDPNHLVLGCRFAGMGAKRFAWEAAGKVCDVLTFNKYPWADLDRNAVFMGRNSTQLFADAVAERHAWCGRPLLITEWSFPAIDAGLPCSNGAGQRFRTQAQRVQATELMARTLLSLPFMVGYDYFMWVDEPALGISYNFPEDSNYGLVNEKGEPYAGLVEMFSRLHKDIAALHRAPLPPIREAPPSAKPPRTVEEALARLGASGGSEAEPPSFAKSAEGAYTLSTASGLTLSGRIGGSGLASSVKFGGVEYGPFTAMLYHGKWQDVERVVSAEWDAERGALRVAGEGRSGEKAWRITCDFIPVREGARALSARVAGTSPESGGARAPSARVLVSVVSVENIGAVPLDGCSAWLRQYPSWAVEKLTGGFRTAIDVWKQPDADIWMRSADGVWCGAATTSLLVTNFHYWVTPDKVTHPDASFAPPGGFTLAPGESWDPQGGAWYLAGVGTGGADGWRAFLDAYPQ